MWGDMGRCGEMGGDLGRWGRDSASLAEIWGDVGRSPLGRHHGQRVVAASGSAFQLSPHLKTKVATVFFTGGARHHLLPRNKKKCAQVRLMTALQVLQVHVFLVHGRRRPTLAAPPRA